MTLNGSGKIWSTAKRDEDTKTKVIVAIIIDNLRKMFYTNSNKKKAVEQGGYHIEGTHRVDKRVA